MASAKRICASSYVDITNTVRRGSWIFCRCRSGSKRECNQYQEWIGLIIYPYLIDIHIPVLQTWWEQGWSRMTYRRCICIGWVHTTVEFHNAIITHLQSSANIYAICFWNCDPMCIPIARGLQSHLNVPKCDDYLDCYTFPLGSVSDAGRGTVGCWS